MDRLIKVGFYLCEQSLAKLHSQLLLLRVAVLGIALLLHSFVIHELDLLRVKLGLCSVRLLNLP